MSAVAAVSAEPKGARALPAEQWQLSTFKDLFSCKRCPLSLGRSVDFGPVWLRPRSPDPSHRRLLRENASRP